MRRRTKVHADRRTGPLARPVMVLALWLPLAGCMDRDIVDHCEGREGDLLFVSAEPPTNEGARFFLIEIYHDGTEEAEKEVPASRCVAFEPEHTGEYSVEAAYWIEGTDCAYLDEQTVDWRGERATVVFDEGFRRECELEE